MDTEKNADSGYVDSHLSPASFWQLLDEFTDYLLEPKGNQRAEVGGMSQFHRYLGVDKMSSAESKRLRRSEAWQRWPEKRDFGLRTDLAVFAGLMASWRPIEYQSAREKFGIDDFDLAVPPEFSWEHRFCAFFRGCLVGYENALKDEKSSEELDEHERSIKGQELRFLKFVFVNFIERQCTTDQCLAYPNRADVLMLFLACACSLVQVHTERTLEEISAEDAVLGPSNWIELWIPKVVFDGVNTTLVGTRYLYFKTSIESEFKLLQRERSSQALFENLDDLGSEDLVEILGKAGRVDEKTDCSTIRKNIRGLVGPETIALDSLQGEPYDYDGSPSPDALKNIFGEERLNPLPSTLDHLAFFFDMEQRRMLNAGHEPEAIVELFARIPNFLKWFQQFLREYLLNVETKSPA